MKSLFTAAACATLALSGAAPAHAYDEAERDQVFKDFPDMPPLGVFKMKEMTPKLFRTFLSINDVLSKEGAFEYIGPIEREVINTVTSAANNCEICLSFHTSSLARQKAMSNEDIALLAAGGLPVNNKYTNLAIAAKYANAHKGILLEREKAHLAELGFNLDHQYEVTFLVGQMTANNMVFASLINEGAPVEDGLKKMGPFKDTVYKSLKEEM